MKQQQIINLRREIFNDQAELRSLQLDEVFKEVMFQKKVRREYIKLKCPQINKILERLK